MASAKVIVGRALKKKRPSKDKILYTILILNLLVSTVMVGKLFGVI